MYRPALYIAWSKTVRHPNVARVRTPGRQARPPETAYRIAFGQRVRALRERAGVSQEDLAHAIGMSRRYMSGIERGEANPSLDQLVRIASGLGVEVRKLMPPIPTR
jgi:DNA-binding XRE family transcriptional regulator